MTDTKKTNRKKAAPRDAYDDFLDMVNAEAQEPGTKKKASASKKSSEGRRTERKADEGKKTSGAKKSGGAKSSDAKKSGEKKTSGEKKSVGKGRSGSSATKKASGSNGAKTSSSAAKKPSSSPKTSAAAAAGSGKRGTSGGSRGEQADAVRRGSANVSAPRRRGAVNYVDNERDAFDEFLEQAERYSARRKKKKKGSPAVAVLLIMGILGIGTAAFWQTTQYQDFQVMKTAVQRQGFYEGTTVEGVNVSGKTLQQAMDYWSQVVEPAYSQRKVTLNNGASFTAEELGYSSDFVSVLTYAYGAGRSGSLEERYEAISARSAQPVDYSISRVPYSSENIVACVTAIAQQIDRPAQDAAIESFNPDTLTFTFRDEVVGSRLDAQKLAQDMAYALENGGGNVEMRVEALQPQVRRSEIEDDYGMITSAVTNASSSNKNRLTNIKLALSSINGTCLKPGETFSFNQTVGKRTKDRGYKVATAYSGGEVTEEVGGGICQVSTTLFNAAVKAGLEIVERHNHSLTVSYVDLGKDAAVNWNSQDLRFTNNTEDNIYIYCRLSDDKRVYVYVFGKLLPDGMSITVEGKTTETIPYETVSRPSLSLAPGTSQVVQKGKNGFKAVAYKILHDASGKEIDRELLCRSTYKSITEIIEYGP